MGKLNRLATPRPGKEYLPMAKEVTPELAQFVGKIPEVELRQFELMVDEYVSARDIETEFANQKKDASEMLKALITKYPELGKVQIPGKCSVSLGEGRTTKTIKEDLLKVALLEKGLSVDAIREVLTASTNVTISPPVLTIRTKKD